QVPRLAAAENDRPFSERVPQMFPLSRILARDLHRERTTLRPRNGAAGRRGYRKELSLMKSLILKSGVLALAVSVLALPTFAQTAATKPTAKPEASKAETTKAAAKTEAPKAETK